MRRRNVSRVGLLRQAPRAQRVGARLHQRLEREPCARDRQVAGGRRCCRDLDREATIERMVDPDQPAAPAIFALDEAVRPAWIAPHDLGLRADGGEGRLQSLEIAVERHLLADRRARARAAGRGRSPRFRRIGLGEPSRHLHARLDLADDRFELRQEAAGLAFGPTVLRPSPGGEGALDQLGSRSGLDRFQLGETKGPVGALKIGRDDLVGPGPAVVAVRQDRAAARRVHREKRALPVPRGDPHDELHPRDPVREGARAAVGEQVVAAAEDLVPSVAHDPPDEPAGLVQVGALVDVDRRGEARAVRVVDDFVPAPRASVSRTPATRRRGRSVRRSRRHPDRHPAPRPARRTNRARRRRRPAAGRKRGAA